jgi:hypothetical protein
MKRPLIHPAQFSVPLIDPIVSLLKPRTPRRGDLLDPMAGLGWRLAQIGARLDMNPFGVEIEPGYFTTRQTHSCVRLGDSRFPMWTPGSFDAWVSSFPYPNGMSDDWQAREDSDRNTYAHRMRRWLGADYRMAAGNSGAMSPRRSPNAYARFLDVHRQVLATTFEAVKPGAWGVVNVKDTVHVPFVEDTIGQLESAGFVNVNRAVNVAARGNRQGAHADRRAECEVLILCQKPG